MQHLLVDFRNTDAACLQPVRNRYSDRTLHRAATSNGVGVQVYQDKAAGGVKLTTRLLLSQALRLRKHAAAPPLTPLHGIKETYGWGGERYEVKSH